MVSKKWGGGHFHCRPVQKSKGTRTSPFPVKNTGCIDDAPNCKHFRLKLYNFNYAFAIRSRFVAFEIFLYFFSVVSTMAGYHLAATSSIPKNRIRDTSSSSRT